MDSIIDVPADAPAKAPILLITGFLGSGKTTLLNRLLRSRTGARLGVVVNEFGQIGIDGTVLGEGDILELSDGCVCCATGTELWEAALSLVDRAGVTHLLVETSGIAEPAVLLRQYAELPVALQERLDLRGLLCLVDVLHIHDSITRRAEARHQLAEADRLLLTKLDLCDAAQLAEVHRLLDELHASPDRAGLPPSAPDGDVAQVLNWALSPSCRGGAGPVPVHRHGHDGQLCAVSIQEKAPLLLQPLRQLLQELPGEVLRVKGFVRLAPPEEGVALLELAGRRVEVRPCTQEQADRAPPGSTLVFIGEGLDESWLRLRLSACRAAGQPG